MTDTDVVQHSGPGAADRRRPAHSTRPGAVPARRIVAAVGALAAGGGTVLGTVALVRAEHPGPARTEAHKITAAAPAFPLARTELLALLDRPADLGPLGDPARRASCLSGLGYPAAQPVLGARPIRLAGRDAVVLVLGDDPARLSAVAVSDTCSSADTGLLADTTLRRP